MYQYLVNCNAIQPSLQFPLSFVYEDSIAKDDISRTVKEVVEGVNILKYVDFSHRNSYGYDGMKMLECVLLAFALKGYASVRELEDLCKYDIRFQFIMNGQTPSHMAFHRFIHDDLLMPVEDLFVEFNKYFESHKILHGDFKGAWGVKDSIIFTQAKNFLDSYKTNKPFALYILTADTHHPNGFVDTQYCQGFEKPFKTLCAARIKSSTILSHGCRARDSKTIQVSSS